MHHVGCMAALNPTWFGARAAGFEPVIFSVHVIHPFGVAWTISSPYLIKRVRRFGI